MVSRIFPASHFCFRKITVERPLRLNFQASPERIACINEERAFQVLAKSRKRGQAATNEIAQGRRFQEEIIDLLENLPDTKMHDRADSEEKLDRAVKAAGLKLSAPVRKAILSALSERDETAAICCNRDGSPEPDPELRDSERVPLAEDVNAFFAREVAPHVPDAWSDESKRDARDGQVGVVGYEISFNRYFYRYDPPRALAEIDSDFRKIEEDIVRLLSEVTATASVH